MKMINKVGLSETPRWDTMNEIKKMQITLDRIYNELRGLLTDTEMAALSGGIANLNYALLKLNNNRTSEVEKNAKY